MRGYIAPLYKGDTMSYSCRIYKASGFNSCNIPDSPDLLDTVNFIDVPALNIMQDRFLSEIRVKATWSQVKNADYAYLYNDTTGAKWYYAVESVNMATKDVAVLGVVPDYINSIGGVDNLKIVDGITERVHVSDDTFGRYTASDPLTTPSEPLQIDKVWVQVSDDARVIVESTVDLPWQMSATDGVTFTDTDTETGETSTVVVPTVATFPQSGLTVLPTYYELSGTEKKIQQGTTSFLPYDTTKADGATYDVGSTVRAGMNRLRSLGIENAIISQVSIPTEYVEITSHSGALIGSKYSWGMITSISGKWTTNTINIPFVSTSAKNNRVNYGEFTKYGIITTSGESCEYDAEEIVQGSSTSPSITKVGDPRPSGKPYFRFTTVNGDSSQLGFFRNCVSGLPWKNVPLVYRESSGNALNTMRYENSKAVSTQSYEYGTQSNALSQLQNMVGTTSGIIGNAVTGNLAGVLQTGVSGGFDAVSLAMQQENRRATTNITRRNELAELEIANTVYTPTVNFPMNAEFIRDFYGNGCLVYRYLYSNNDVSRIDKLLTMYGYRFAKALTKSDFTNRTNFNFVKCSNVTVTGHARWINDGIHEQLANGVRVWHVLPDSKYYNNNPIKE